MNSIFNYTVAVLFFLSSINSYAREKELLKVQQIKNELKQLYTGIDEEIEQVVTHVEEWLSLSPDQQKTPFVLNIWGPAGTGKTSLVKTILSKLNLNYIYLHAGREKREGSFILPIVASLEDSTTNNFLSYTSYKKNSRMVIIVDEVQELRDGNKEQEKDGSQSRFAAEMWEVLGNQGIIRVNNKDYLNRKTFLALSLAELIALFNSSASEDVLEKIDQRRSEIATLAQKELEDMQVQTSIDISNALVINIGNLNNAYPTPTEGMSLNDWRKLSQHQVTKGHILSKLLEIFSPQNVSRLGSNHIAFHPIDSQSLKKLIKKHLHQNSQNLKGVKVNFSLDFYNRVQQEFDIQELGIRALENLISQFTAEGLKQLSQYLNSNDRLNVTEIYIDTNSSALQATWTVKSGNGSKLAEFSFDIPSDKAKLFTPLPPIQRAENSVLAAAYTLLNMVIFKEVPDIVRLRSGKNKNNILVSSFSDSSMSIRYPEERSLYLAYKFAERAASQLAFGQKKWIDSQEITKFAIDSVRGYGIEREQNSGEVIAGFTRDLSPSTHDDRVIIDTQLVKLDELHFEKEVTREIENAMALSSEILRREEKFFKALIRALRFESMELRYEDIIKIAKMSWSSQADLTEIIQFDQRRRESSEPIVYRNFDCEAALNSYLLDEPNN